MKRLFFIGLVLLAANWLAFILVGFDYLSMLATTFGCFAVIALFVIYEGDVIVTNQRFIRRRGWFRRKSKELLLSEIEQVEGLERGTVRPLSILTRQGESLALDGYLEGHSVGRAVSRAAGLAEPGYAPLVERASGPIWAAAGINALTMLGLFAWLLWVLGKYLEPGLAVVLLVLGTLIIGPLVAWAGWVLGSMFGVLYLRPVLTHDQIRSTILFDATHGKKRRPLLLRWASFLYGRDVTGESQDLSESSPDRNGASELRP